MSTAALISFPVPASAGQATAAERRPVIQTGSTRRQTFQPSPLRSDWILQGNPEARSLPIAGTQDGLYACGQWECEAGVFKYVFPCDEIVHILEGEVSIREENGARHQLRAGDVALFPEGLVTEWTVHQYVRKFAVFRNVKRSIPARIAGKVKRVWKAVLNRLAA